MRTPVKTDKGAALLLGLACLLGCSGPRSIPGVVQPAAGESLDSVPGPMPGFGPYPNYSDALLAACPLILGKPHALAGQPRDPNFALRWRLSTEYCAWIYHTPDNQYELSMLAMSTLQGDPTLRRCDLPPRVEDPRYPRDSLGYVFVLHNHPYPDPISPDDIRYIVSVGRLHGFEVRTPQRKIPLSIVAFYSESLEQPPRCDGFYQYAPLEGHILQWTHEGQGRWSRREIATVNWTGPDAFDITTN